MLRAAVANAPSGERVRVASIGCGPAWEVLTLANEHPEDAARLSLVMLDQDARALEHVRAMLKSIPGGEAMDTSFVAADVEALTDEGHTLQALGCPALIYSSGLFDYFSDAVFARYASALYRALPRGGRLVIGNLSVTNPSRWTMEFVTDWYVFHRSREDLQRLGGTLQPTPRVVSVDSEPLGANLFLVVDR